MLLSARIGWLNTQLKISSLKFQDIVEKDLLQKSLRGYFLPHPVYRPKKMSEIFSFWLLRFWVSFYFRSQFDNSRYNATAICVADPGGLDAYIKVHMHPGEVKDCNNEMGRRVFLYPNKDLHLQPYMKAELGLSLFLSGESVEPPANMNTA